ncbi:bifunctional copper resistance protein CopD/cytochrome c oxidase assembly protein [Corynebacterium sp.]|uniref:bifunctional copper resistance protein CopD/cytochrome c oxidase assembly protein n=1 Tax=Corynebacterium sp. TaxID=1720 RepID=UPI002A913C3B|nr:cytochrome c oxidase assembly protein [Corynebacterium sp.]MDY5786289.1 cytochrome c oxidase assembly protein [Corynebacterium sp.]
MSEKVAVTKDNGARAGRGVRSAWTFYLTALAVSALIAGGVSQVFLTESLAALGIPDPGALTTFALPALRGTAWMLVALAVGSFLFSAFLIPPRQAGPDLNGARLTVDGHIASRAGGWASISVALISLTMIPLVLSDVSGTPFGSVVLQPLSWETALSQVADARTWLIVGAISLVVGVAALVSRSWWSQVALFIGAIISIMPLGLTGHSASGGDHDYGTNSYLWHLTFMLIWVGALMALVAHGRRLGPHLAAAVERYSRIALFAFIVMLLSGVINAAIRVRPEDLTTYNYGWVLVAKTVGLLVLGLVGYAHRQVIIPRLRRGEPGFVRLATVEVLLMALVTGLAVTLGRTPPPPPRDPNLSEMQLALGYELDQPLTTFNWLGMWRPELLYSVIALLLAGYYLWLTRRVNDWKIGRTVWWLLGNLITVVTMSSGIGMHMAASFTAHMVVHMILSMTVPVALVLGAPLTLVKRAYPAGEFNPRLWVESFERSRFLRVVTYPPVSMCQFVFFFYVMYVSIPLYELLISEHAGHVIMNAVFLISGYFYFWELIGPDHIAGRFSARARLAWLWVSMPIHLFMGVYLMQLNIVMGEEFYRSLALPWQPDLLADQKVGGGIAWASGSFPLVIVFGALFWAWWSEDRAESQKIDREAQESDDEEWRRYNEMLAQYSHTGGSGK